MSADPPFRAALVVIAGFAAGGTMVELALIGHWHGPLQLIPWAVAYTTLTAAWATATPTDRGRLRLAQVLVAANIMGCAYGSAIHLRANYRFAAEIMPDATTAALIGEAAQGRIPLLAPLVLTLPSLLIAVATWRHPGLQHRPSTPGGAVAGDVLAVGATDIAPTPSL